MFFTVLCLIYHYSTFAIKLTSSIAGNYHLYDEAYCTAVTQLCRNDIGDLNFNPDDETYIFSIDLTYLLESVYLTRIPEAPRRDN